MDTLDTFEADLAGFAHDWIMRDQARSTLKEYERQLRRYRAHDRRREHFPAGFAGVSAAGGGTVAVVRKARSPSVAGVLQVVLERVRRT
jgi:hypothetical protein